jgi:proteasome activator subunit 4
MELFYRQLSWYMGYVAEHARRFFHPAAIQEMLSTFVPLIDGSKLDVSYRFGRFFDAYKRYQSLLAPQYYLLTFLPITHPQSYLPMLFRMWESINSYMYDERMLDFLSRLAEMHVAPEISDPRKIAEIPDDERSEGEGRPTWSGDGFNDLPDSVTWPGIYKDVGIFTEHEWHLVMCKCLASMGMVDSASPQLLFSSFLPFRNSTCRCWITYNWSVCGQRGWF